MFNRFYSILYFSLILSLRLQCVWLFNCQDFINRMTSVVDLSKQNIATLNGGICTTSNNVIQTLNLAENSITNLTEDNFNRCFCGLNNLGELRMSKNVLTDMTFLQGLNNLRILYIDNNYITQINSWILNTLQKLEKLDLSNNQIINLQHHVFMGEMLPNLREIYLQNNKITFVHPFTFHQLNSLTTLVLSNNFIKDINSKIFSGVINIETLYLHSNDLGQLRANTFAGLQNLKMVTIYANQIQTISKDLFGGTELMSLSYFTMDKNKIKYIPSNLFRNAPNINYWDLSFNNIENIDNIKLPNAIQTIYMHHNSIRILHKDSFAAESSDAIMKLKHFVISDNKIYRIHPEAFAKFVMLESLDLSANMIDELNKNIFSNLRNLKSLKLFANSLIALPATLFSNLISIESIYLYGNKIQRIGAEIFSTNIMNSLTYFTIDHNELYEIDTNTFVNTPNIKYMDVSSNKIIDINSIIWPVHLETLFLLQNNIMPLQRNAFGNSNGEMSNLKLLHLGQNHIQNIDQFALSSLKWLEHLDLSANNIENFNEWTFNELIHLKTLDINGNDLMTFVPGIFSELHNLESLYIYGNKLITLNGDMFGEQILESLKIFSIDKNQIVYVESDSFVYTPNVGELNLAHNKIVDISLIVLPINVKIIHLYNNRIRNLVEGCFTRSSTSRITELHFDNNQITNIDPKAFIGFNSLKVLDLSKNMIRTINGNTFKHLKNLNTLDLNTNLIDMLVPGIFQEMGKLERIRLYANNIKTIDGEMFGTTILQSLNYFTIDYNYLEEIGANTFEMTPNINYMDIANNKLVRINSSELPINIETLDISHNEITSLEDMSFVKINHLSKLKDLRINNNYISEVAALAFSGLNELQILRLFDNRIQNFNENTFNDLISLEILDLHSNLLEYITPGLFNKLYSMKQLIMYRNNIHKITGDMFGEKLPLLSYFTIDYNNLDEINPFTFMNTPNINYMDLSHNNLVTLDDNLFSTLTQLSYLDITHNKIRSLPENLFATVNGLNNLKISYNRLTFLLGMQLYFSKLKNIAIDGNPWQCSCLDEILNYATVFTVRYTDSNNLYYNGKKPICIVTKFCAEDENLVLNNSFVQSFDATINNN